MRWSDVLVLYRRELRSALRERTIVVNSILLPVFLYPVLLWVMFSAITFVEGLAEGFVSRVAVEAPPAGHASLLDSLAAHEEIELLGGDVGPADAEEARARLRGEALDAYVVFLPPEEGGEDLPGNLRIRVLHDASVGRSRRARMRVEDVVDRYRADWLDREAEALGVGRAAADGFRVATEDVASDRQLGAFLLAMTIPLFLVIMVALGCFVPSVDTTAGERERSTWETLMTVSASRLSVVTAKYLYVATLGVLAGVLNVVAIFVSMGAVVAPLMENSGESMAFSIPLMAVPVMVLGAVALALFFAAAMMILAAFARTFKEGQSMVMPVYWLTLAPLLVANSPDRVLTPAWAAVPLVNVSLMIKDAIRGVFQWALIAETVAVELVLVALCLLLARAILRFEDFLLGGYDGSFWRFARERLAGTGGAAR